MEELFTTKYDRDLQNGLPHLKNYPQMLPFIGRYWDETSNKILLLGESHYIPGDEVSLIKNESHLTDWYKNDSKSFYVGLADYLNTRKVVNKAEKLKEYGFAKPLSMYYNLKKELKAHIIALKNEEYIFPYLSYYNYFQRPAFIETASILNNKQDDEVAYFTIRFITQLIKPNKIIFASRKAKSSFNQQLMKDDEKELFENIVIDVVPHASSPWWNRKSSAWGNQTGREKFIKLITS